MKFDANSIYESVWQAVDPLLANVKEEGKALAKAEMTSFAERLGVFVAAYFAGKPWNDIECRMWLQDEIDHARGVLYSITELGLIGVELVTAQQGKVALAIIEAIPSALGL